MEKFRKRVPKKERFLILSEHFDSGLSISELSRKYQITPTTIYRWREQMKQEKSKKGHLDPKDLLEEWVYDYNHKAPHSALGMKSPVEYIKSTTLR